MMIKFLVAISTFCFLTQHVAVAGLLKSSKIKTEQCPEGTQKTDSAKTDAKIVDQVLSDIFQFEKMNQLSRKTVLDIALQFPAGFTHCHYTPPR